MTWIGKVENVDIFPDTVVEELPPVEHHVTKKEFENLVSEKPILEFCIYQKDGSKVSFLVTDKGSPWNRARIGHFARTGEQSTEPHHLDRDKSSWHKVIRKLRLPVNKCRQNGDTRMGWIIDKSTYLVKSQFTFGVRRVEPGQRHVVQTTHAPLLCFLEKRDRHQKIALTQKIRCLDHAYREHYDKCTLKPHTTYVIEKGYYVLQTYTKSLFSLHILSETVRLRDAVVVRPDPQTRPQDVYEAPPPTPALSAYRDREETDAHPAATHSRSESPSRFHFARPKTPAPSMATYSQVVQVTPNLQFVYLPSTSSSSSSSVSTGTQDPPVFLHPAVPPVSTSSPPPPPPPPVFLHPPVPPVPTVGEPPRLLDRIVRKPPPPRPSTVGEPPNRTVGNPPLSPHGQRCVREYPDPKGDWQPDPTALPEEPLDLSGALDPSLPIDLSSPATTVDLSRPVDLSSMLGDSEEEPEDLSVPLDLSRLPEPAADLSGELSLDGSHRPLSDSAREPAADLSGELSSDGSRRPAESMEVTETFPSTQESMDTAESPRERLGSTPSEQTPLDFTSTISPLEYWEHFLDSPNLQASLDRESTLASQNLQASLDQNINFF